METAEVQAIFTYAAFSVILLVFPSFYSKTVSLSHPDQTYQERLKNQNISFLFTLFSIL